MEKSSHTKKTMSATLESGIGTDPVLRESIRNGIFSVAVIPVGSVEQHGPHLPVSTDSDIASEVARRVAKDNGYLLLPAVTYGVSYEHAPFLNLSVSPDTLHATLCDLCISLYANGIRAVVVINGHHGNIEALKDIEHLGTVGAAPTVCVFHYWRYVDCELGHAGFAETCMMLAISADAVRMDLAEKGLVTDGMSDEQIKAVSELASREFVTATGNGIWGDPSGATAREGLRILKEAADGISAECIQRLAGD